MTRQAAAAVVALCGALGASHAAAAAPCVGTQLEIPLPDATAVEIRHADVPSALFSGIWQQGILNGLAYRIYSGGAASIGDAPEMARWRLDMSCDAQARKCERLPAGDVPPPALQVADRIESCLIGPAPGPAPTAAMPAEPASARQQPPAPDMAEQTAAVPSPPSPAPGTPADPGMTHRREFGTAATEETAEQGTSATAGGPEPALGLSGTDGSRPVPGAAANAGEAAVKPMRSREGGGTAPNPTSPRAADAAPPPSPGEALASPRPLARPKRIEAPEPHPGWEGPAVLPLPLMQPSPGPPDAKDAAGQPMRIRTPDALTRTGASGPEPRILRAKPAPDKPAPVPRPPGSATPNSTRTSPVFRTSCSTGGALSLKKGKLTSFLGCTLDYRGRLTVSASVIGYPLEEQKRSGDPEYTYALTWRVTENVSLTYANYAAAFTGGRGLAGLGEGRLQLSRRLPPFDLSHGRGSLSCSVFVSAAPHSPENAGLSCGWPMSRHLNFRMTGYLYLPGTQREGDADYSYSASLTLRPNMTLTWSNYSNNRWFWNRTEQSERFLHGGSISIAYTFHF